MEIEVERNLIFVWYIECKKEDGLIENMTKAYGSFKERNEDKWQQKVKKNLVGFMKPMFSVKL